MSDIDQLFSMSRADRQAAKFRRLFERMGQWCRVVPFDGDEPVVRLVNLAGSKGEIAASAGNEYMPEKIMQAEFLVQDGKVFSGDTVELGDIDALGDFVADGTKLKLTLLSAIDAVSVTYVYLEL
ncbi:hypothetical protein [Shewanella algae]|uniref:hypothetical protein n=1 Tax=Shewanella algae TaxID=38313 RepID=UPI000D14FF4F|nr:hypothetical protein [Shewanella algae]MBO2589536.1 hypothetical protein [Shewanella algae]MBO2684987.1 hypothetical protein [Shewanella algae]MDO8254807.1 hypothetical protein [Shewanella algae]PST68882.1 hypothetical protein AYI77_01935 [Shewanella algae]